MSQLAGPTPPPFGPPEGTPPAAPSTVAPDLIAEVPSTFGAPIGDPLDPPPGARIPAAPVATSTDENLDASWRTSLALVGLATAILIAGFILVLTTDRKGTKTAGTTAPIVLASETSVESVAASTAASTAAASTAAASTAAASTAAASTAAASTAAASTAAPTTTTAAPKTTAGPTTTADPHRRIAADPGIPARVAIVQAVAPDGRLCGSFPGVIVDNKGLVMSPATEPANCSGADYIVKLAVAGGSNQLDVQYRATLAARDVRRGVSILRVDRDANGNYLPAPRLMAATVSNSAPATSLHMVTISTVNGLTTQGQAIPVSNNGGAVAPGLSVGADGGILHDTAGNVVGFVLPGSGSQPLWVNETSDLLKAASGT